MRGLWLFDTDILVEYLRGRPAAIEFLEGMSEELLMVSTITIAELFVGVNGAEERNRVEDCLLAFYPVEVTGSVARNAGSIRKQFGRSHGTGFTDALIAATALETNARLVTFNKKHFPMLRNLRVPYVRTKQG